MESSDFIVVGGGVYGAATAFHLARNGADVVLIEKGEIADGASGGVGKRGIRVNKRDLREVPLVAEAYEMWPRLSDDLEGPTGYENTGGVYLIENEMEGLSGGMVAAQARAAVQSALGAPTEVWERDQLLNVLPDLSAQITGGLYAPLDSVASQAMTTESYANAARIEGASVHLQSLVTGIVLGAHGRVVGIHTAGGHEFRAKKGVVLANNVGAISLIEDSLDVQMPMWSVYPQALIVRMEYKPAIPLLVGHDSRKLSIKEFGSELVQLTGGWRGEWDSAAGMARLSPSQVRNNISEFRAVFPEVGEVVVEAAYVDRAEAVSIDEVPIVGEVCPGLHVAIGWTAHGWAMAPSVSKHLADELLGKNLGGGLAAFRPDRLRLF